MFKNRKKQAERGMDRLAAVARRDDVRKDAMKVWSDVRSLAHDVTTARRRKSRFRAFAGVAAVAGMAGAAAWALRGRRDEAAMASAAIPPRSTTRRRARQR